jgi:hypothetical protein
VVTKPCSVAVDDVAGCVESSALRLKKSALSFGIEDELAITESWTISCCVRWRRRYLGGSARTQRKRCSNVADCWLVMRRRMDGGRMTAARSDECLNLASDFDSTI